MDHLWHLVYSKVLVSFGNPSILSDFLSLFWPKCSYPVSMATGMLMDKRSIDCLVLGHHDQDRKVSAKSVTMRAMTLCKNLSGYRELLLTRQFYTEFMLKKNRYFGGKDGAHLNLLNIIFERQISILASTPNNSK